MMLNCEACGLPASVRYSKDGWLCPRCHSRRLLLYLSKAVAYLNDIMERCRVAQSPEHPARSYIDAISDLAEDIYDVARGLSRLAGKSEVRLMDNDEVLARYGLSRPGLAEVTE